MCPTAHLLTWRENTQQFTRASIKSYWCANKKLQKCKSEGVSRNPRNPPNCKSEGVSRNLRTPPNCKSEGVSRNLRNSPNCKSEGVSRNPAQKPPKLQVRGGFQEPQKPPKLPLSIVISKFGIACASTVSLFLSLHSM